MRAVFNSWKCEKSYEKIFKMMTKKERAINLANALLFEWDTKTNQNTAAIRFVNSEHYEIFSEAVENGWISDRFHFNEGLMMDGVRIEKKD